VVAAYDHDIVIRFGKWVQNGPAFLGGRAGGLVMDFATLSKPSKSKIERKDAFEAGPII